MAQLLLNFEEHSVWLYLIFVDKDDTVEFSIQDTLQISGGSWGVDVNIDNCCYIKFREKSIHYGLNHLGNVCHTNKTFSFNRTTIDNFIEVLRRVCNKKSSNMVFSAEEIQENQAKLSEITSHQ